MTDGASEDPRRAIDDLIASTDPAQWFQALRDLGGPLADERIHDLAEYRLLDYGNALSISKSSGIDLSSIEDISNMDFSSVYELTGQERIDALGDIAGLLAAIRRCERLEIRSNTADLFRSSRDRDVAFRIAARAQRSNFVVQSPPDFQWHITAAGIEWSEGPKPPEDQLEEEGAD
jgi:hypothetical protein